MNAQEIPLFIAGGTDAPRPELPFVKRSAITAVLYDPKQDKYLGLKWKEVDWDTLITGGIEAEQTPEEAARTEIMEETGYANIKLITELPPYDAQFFHHPKGVNRYAHFRCFLFQLESDARAVVSKEEVAKHDTVWLSFDEMKQFRLPEGHRFVFDHAVKAMAN
jgi:8-oxo-dGTP pyrophosphatase MutT (NUDIX family)